jgi:hypothetical protein
VQVGKVDHITKSLEREDKAVFRLILHRWRRFKHGQDAEELWWRRADRKLKTTEEKKERGEGRAECGEWSNSKAK